MDDFVRTGGCLCSAVRYRFTAPALEIHHCHCSIYRKVHGTLFGTFSVILKDYFTVETRVDNLVPYQSSERLHRNFCKTCGCHLFDELEQTTSVVELATGTIADGAHPGHPEATRHHIFVGSKVPWYAIDDGLPRHEEF